MQDYCFLFGVASDYLDIKGSRQRLFWYLLDLVNVAIYRVVFRVKYFSILGDVKPWDIIKIFALFFREPKLSLRPLWSKNIFLSIGIYELVVQFLSYNNCLINFILNLFFSQSVICICILFTIVGSLAVIVVYLILGRNCVSLSIVVAYWAFYHLRFQPFFHWFDSFSFPLNGLYLIVVQAYYEMSFLEVISVKIENS